MRVNFTIYYVDGSIESGAWNSLRSEGVDFVMVEIGPNYSIHIASSSLYWSYTEGNNVIVGWGSVRYDPNPLKEIVIFPNGEQQERVIKFMPDLMHSDIKLGWWWLGTSEPVDG